MALKDAFLPHVFAACLGNYLPSGARGTAVFSASQQVLALGLVGAYELAEALGSEGGRDKIG